MLPPCRMQDALGSERLSSAGHGVAPATTVTPGCAELRVGARVDRAARVTRLEGGVLVSGAVAAVRGAAVGGELEGRGATDLVHEVRILVVDGVAGPISRRVLHLRRVDVLLAEPHKHLWTAGRGLHRCGNEEEES